MPLFIGKQKFRTKKSEGTGKGDKEPIPSIDPGLLHLLFKQSVLKILNLAGNFSTLCDAKKKVKKFVKHIKKI